MCNLLAAKFKTLFFFSNASMELRTFTVIHPRRIGAVGTLAKTEIIYPKNVRVKVAMDFTQNKVIGTHGS